MDFWTLLEKARMGWFERIALKHVYSVQFSCSVMSDSLQPHGLQHARLPCPSPNPRACSNSCPSSWWCYPTILSSVVPFSSCLQSSQHQGLFKWVISLHQVAKVLEFQLQHQSFQWIFRTDFFRIDWFDLLAIQGTLRSLLQHHSSKASILWCSAFLIAQLSHPSSQWCHPAISSSVIPLSCLQSFLATGSFPMSQFFAWGDQSIGVSASASDLPMNIQDWFPLGLTGWISLQSKGLWSLLQHHSSKASVLWHSVFFMVQHSLPYLITGKT